MLLLPDIPNQCLCSSILSPMLLLPESQVQCYCCLGRKMVGSYCVCGPITTALWSPGRWIGRYLGSTCLSTSNACLLLSIRYFVCRMISLVVLVIMTLFFLVYFHVYVYSELYTSIDCYRVVCTISVCVYVCVCVCVSLALPICWLLLLLWHMHTFCSNTPNWLDFGYDWYFILSLFHIICLWIN